MELGGGHDLHDALELLPCGPGDQDGAGRERRERAHGVAHLLRGLARSEHRLDGARSELSMVIEAGVGEVLVGQLAKPLDRLVN